MILTIIVTVLILLLFPSITFAQTLVINEIMARPSDNTEWVEIYNPTGQPVDLTGWKIKDGNSLSNDDLTLTGQIDSYGYKTFDHSKGWLNDSGSETVTLLDNSGNTVNSYSYNGATQGKTYGRQPDGGTWASNLDPTKGSSNGDISPTPTPVSTPSPSPTSTPTPTSSPSVSSTSKAKTANATPTLTSSPNPSTPPPSPQRIVTTTAIPKLKSQTASVAAATTSATPSVEVKSEKKPNYIPWIGLVLVVCGIGSLIYIYLSRKKLP